MRHLSDARCLAAGRRIATVLQSGGGRQCRRAGRCWSSALGEGFADSLDVGGILGNADDAPSRARLTSISRRHVQPQARGHAAPRRHARDCRRTELSSRPGPMTISAAPTVRPDLRLSSTSALPLARLEIEDAATRRSARALAGRSMPARGGPRRPGASSSGHWRRSCSIVAVTFYGIPLVADRLAPLRAMSRSRSGSARRSTGRCACCSAARSARAGGRAAFAAMMEKLQAAAASSCRSRRRCCRRPSPNAFALPGGKVYLLDGLLQKARKSGRDRRRARARVRPRAASRQPAQADPDRRHVFPDRLAAR